MSFTILPRIETSEAVALFESLVKAGRKFERLDATVYRYEQLSLDDDDIKVEMNTITAHAKRLDAIKDVAALGQITELHAFFERASVHIKLVGGSIRVHGVSFEEFAATGVKLTDAIREISFH